MTEKDELQDTDSTGGSRGGTAGGGTGTTVKMVDFITGPIGAAVYEHWQDLLQEGQKRHGKRATGQTRKRKRSFVTPSLDESDAYGKGVPEHPILKNFAYYFSGIDSPENPDTSLNVDAAEEYEYQMALRFGLGRKKAPTPFAGG